MKVVSVLSQNLAFGNALKVTTPLFNGQFDSETKRLHDFLKPETAKNISLITYGEMSGRKSEGKPLLLLVNDKSAKDASEHLSLQGQFENMKKKLQSRSVLKLQKGLDNDQINVARRRNQTDFKNNLIALQLKKLQYQFGMKENQLYTFFAQKAKTISSDSFKALDKEAVKLLVLG